MGDRLTPRPSSRPRYVCHLILAILAAACGPASSDENQQLLRGSLIIGPEEFIAGCQGSASIFKGPLRLAVFNGGGTSLDAKDLGSAMTKQGEDCVIPFSLRIDSSGTYTLILQNADHPDAGGLAGPTYTLDQLSERGFVSVNLNTDFKPRQPAA
jgi:hypothetical protein